MNHPRGASNGESHIFDCESVPIVPEKKSKAPVCEAYQATDMLLRNARLQN